MVKKSQALNENVDVSFVDSAEPCSEEDLRAAAIALIGAKLDKEDPPCGLEDVLSALGLLGNDTEEEEQTPQEGTRKAGQRYYTKAQSEAIMNKVLPDAELAERFGRTVQSIINHREHVKSKPPGSTRRYEAE